MIQNITKKHFNSLNIKEQVKIFNTLISADNLNITQCCNRIGISYSTIRDRFKKNNYVFNKFKKQYENIESILLLEEDKIIKMVLEEINKNNQVISKLLLDPCSKNNIVNRSFGIDKNTLDRFIRFCNNSKYKQYDILTKFIEDGLIKYEQGITNAF